MANVKLGKAESMIRGWIQHYNHEKYWKIRAIVIDPSSKYSKILRLLFLFYLKRCDAFNNASTGIHLGYGAKFKSVPTMVHGLYGVMISHNAVIGESCTIYHQVTIGDTMKGAPVIGDNVYIGAGAKIIGPVHVGDNARIGANCVVVHDVPANSTVVAQEGIIIKRNYG